MNTQLDPAGDRPVLTVGTFRSEKSGAVLVISPIIQEAPPSGRPTMHRGVLAAAIEEMKPGDCRDITTDGSLANLQQMILTFGRRAGLKLKTRKVNGAMRVWRIA